MDKTPINFGLNISKAQKNVSTGRKEPLIITQPAKLIDNMQAIHFSGKFITTEQYLKTQPNLSFLSLNNSVRNKPLKDSAISFSGAKPNEIRIEDYKPPTHLIEKTDLTFELNSQEDVVVSSSLTIRPNPASDAKENIIQLNGAPEVPPKGSNTPTMELLEVKINGQKLPKDQYTRQGDELTIKNLPESKCNLEIKTRINPKENHALEGLYISSGLFTTQCEAEGFRNMTFYLDRPDVMSKYTTTIIADKGKLPVMLSNGNPGERKDIGNGREQITWTDPFNKPSYLFAMVAGNLDLKEDTFTTKSGRKVKIHLYSAPKDIGKLDHAMESVKQSMKWDEDRFGREYDLDLFQIVAVEDFNAGAMENKGLNVFQTAYVLADPQMATDADYENVQGVIGHEYFHNWTGDRVTLQKWFDLTLKEGLTVFRDQEFTSDMNARGVKRIDDVNVMRSAQFPEDAGAMAHPIRPASYSAIDNFYTSTVYNKGAEVIRMIHTMLGEEDFRKGTDLYFDRHDGQAVTTDDFIKAMEDASKKDLTQFKNTWYTQAGTPTLDIKDSYDPVSKEYKLTIKQSTPKTMGHPDKKPFHIPVRVGLLDSKGNDMKLQLDAKQADLLTNGDVLNLKKDETTFVFKNVSEKPVPSLLRGWSAPVKLNFDYDYKDLTFLMAHDSDDFNRWEAGQKLGIEVLQDLVKSHQQDANKPVDPAFIEACKSILTDKTIDPATAAQALVLPGSGYLSELYPDGKVDVHAIHKAYDQTVKSIGKELEPLLLERFNNSRSTENREYKWTKEDAGERAIKNTALSYLVNANPAKYLHFAIEQFDRNQNLTDVRAALRLIIKHADEKTCQEKLDKFYQDRKDSPTAIYQWFQDQASIDRPNLLDKVKELLNHEAYDAKTPLCVRRLVLGFAANAVNFHKEDGSGYKFIADQAIECDKYNPALAASLVKKLASPHRFPKQAQELIKVQLLRIQEETNSKNVKEIVSNALKLLEKKPG